MTQKTNATLRTGVVHMLDDGTPLTAAIPFGGLSAGAANQDSTVVKAAAAVVTGFSFQNDHATALRFVKLYDKATGPTSADTPVQTYPLSPAGGGIARQPLHMSFANGLSYRVTTGVAANDVGAAASGEVTINLEYI